MANDQFKNQEFSEVIQTLDRLSKVEQDQLLGLARLVEETERNTRAALSAQTTTTCVPASPSLPRYVPDGYLLNRYDGDDNTHYWSIRYRNAAGLCYTVSCHPNMCNKQADSMDAVAEMITIRGEKVLRVTKGTEQALVWKQGICLYQIEGQISCAEMVKIAEGMILEEDARKNSTK